MSEGLSFFMEIFERQMSLKLLSGIVFHLKMEESKRKEETVCDIPFNYY